MRGIIWGILMSGLVGGLLLVMVIKNGKARAKYEGRRALYGKDTVTIVWWTPYRLTVRHKNKLGQYYDFNVYREDIFILWNESR